MVVKKKNKFVYEATSYMDNLKEEELSSYALEIEHIIDKAHNQGISDGLTLKVIEILKKIPNRISTFSKKEFLSIFDDAMKRQIKKLQMIKGFHLSENITSEKVRLFFRPILFQVKQDTAQTLACF